MVNRKFVLYKPKKTQHIQPIKLHNKFHIISMKGCWDFTNNDLKIMAGKRWIVTDISKLNTLMSKSWVIKKSVWFLTNLYTITIPTYIWCFNYCQIFSNLHCLVNVLNRPYTANTTMDMMLMVWVWRKCSTFISNHCKSYISFQNVKIPCNYWSSLWYIY